MTLSIPVLALAVLVTGFSAAPQRTSATSEPLSASVQSRSAPTSNSEALTLAPICAISIKDQANPAACLQATSVPAPGLLFPGPHLGGVNNVQSGTNSFVGGGSGNVAGGSHAAIGGGQNNCAATHGTVGGGLLNDAGAFATVGGGVANSAIDNSVVGGGQANNANGSWAVVGGGYHNSANSYQATVGGGYQNFALHLGFVGGGKYNGAAGAMSTVGGGQLNNAAGTASTIPGGSHNDTTSNYCFAAGRRAKANHQGAFVWGDSQNVDKASSAADQFNIYASGGARIFSNGGATAGVLLAPGGGSWSSVSDRESKENLEPVDARDVLARVCALPISTWNYEAQDDSIRHMGPMAQDFHAAFALGVSEKLIDTVDPDGVALAAIQGLNELVAEKDGEIAELGQRVETLEAELASLKAKLQELAEAR